MSDHADQARKDVDDAVDPTAREQGKEDPAASPVARYVSPVNHAKFFLTLAYVLIACGVVNLVLAVVDISSGASIANNAFSAGLGVVFVVIGVIQAIRIQRSR